MKRNKKYSGWGKSFGYFRIEDALAAATTNAARDGYAWIVWQRGGNGRSKVKWSLSLLRWESHSQGFFQHWPVILPDGERISYREWKDTHTFVAGPGGDRGSKQSIRIN